MHYSLPVLFFYVKYTQTYMHHRDLQQHVNSPSYHSMIGCGYCVKFHLRFLTILHVFVCEESKNQKMCMVSVCILVSVTSSLMIMHEFTVVFKSNT